MHGLGRATAVAAATAVLTLGSVAQESETQGGPSADSLTLAKHLEPKHLAPTPKNLSDYWDEWRFGLMRIGIEKPERCELEVRAAHTAVDSERGDDPATTRDLREFLELQVLRDMFTDECTDAQTAEVKAVSDPIAAEYRKQEAAERAAEKARAEAEAEKREREGREIRRRLAVWACEDRPQDQQDACIVAVMDKRIFLGMTTRELTTALGNPTRRTTQVSAAGVMELLWFGDSLSVILRDDVVQSWTTHE